MLELPQATPTGTVTAVPSKATLAPGEAYTVTVTIPFTNTGMYGAWIDNSANTTSVAAGPNATGPVVVNMIRRHPPPAPTPTPPSA